MAVSGPFVDAACENVARMQPGLVSPVFVGRGAELARMVGAVESAMAGDSAVVIVGGEAGVGKTRLVEEAAARARDAGARVLMGSCIELGGAGLPLSPVVDALRPLVRVMDPDELEPLLGPARDELARLLPELSPERGASLAPVSEEGSARLLELVFGFIQRLAAEQPLMLVLEDLQWADRSTLDLVALLVRALRGVRVLLVVTFRSDELHRGHSLRPLVTGWERVRSVRRVELPRFTREETAGQLEAILGAPAEPPLLELLYERSEGNAFLSEEILGALQEGARPDALPVKLRDVLLVRVERLSAPAVGLLRVASAAGRSVPDRLLSIVSELDEPSLDEALREAVEHHMLVIDDIGQGYRFRHALTRDAIYGDALPRERVRTLSVDRGEVDGLRARAHILRNLVERHVEDQRRGLAVNVTAGSERLHECFIVRQVREQPQLDLRVVGRDEPPPGARDEAAPDVPPELSPDRDVLQVRIAR